MVFKKLLLPAVLLLTITINCNAQIRNDVKNRMQKILIEQYEKHPLMQTQDVYKLIHQAAFGSEHAVKDTVYVKNWLNNEWASCGAESCETVCDTINPFGKIVRINIRAYKYYGGSKEALLAGFINTANNYKGSKKDFEMLWKWAVEFSPKISLSKKEMQMFGLQMKAKGYPAAHHSPVYEKEYKPAYRVLMIQEAGKIK